MLGPLALAASGMEFTTLSSDDDVKTSDLGDSIRNICNSTLFLLYTSGLLIWGVLVNRRRAWRTDGGTAIFGGGSVGLAAINTMVSFVEIAFDRLWWLPDICWTLTVWQSWLGFWWWVGSGMGIGEVEDRAERQERKRKRELRLKRKREKEERMRLKAAQGSGGGAGSMAVAAAASLGGSSSDAIRGGIRRIRERFQGAEGSTTGPTLSRRRRTAQNSLHGENIEMSSVNGQASQGGDVPLSSVAVDTHAGDEANTVAGSGSQSSDTNPTTSGAATTIPGWLGTITDFIAAHQPNFIRRRMRRLRLAHVAAARRAATEQTMLREQVLNRQTASQGPGLRSMVLENRNAPQSPSLQGMTVDANQSNIQSSGTFDTQSASSPPNSTLPVLLDADPRSPSSDTHPSTVNGHNGSRTTTRPLQEDEENEWVDDYMADDADSRDAHDGDADDAPPSSSWTFRGGLQTLRMRDQTSYD